MWAYACMPAVSNVSQAHALSLPCMQRIVRSSWEKPCIVAKNVADFFLARVEAEQAESHHSQRTQLLQFHNWLQALKSQVCEYVPQCAYTLQDPALIEAADLLKLIIAFKDQAWAAYTADMATYGHARVDSIRGIHDAAMICCMFGWLPPMRVSMVTTLLKPYLPHQCLSKGCICDGNYLYWQSTQQQQLAATWNHHKTARKLGGAAITYALPQDLNHMFKILLEPCNRGLLEKKGYAIRTVFVSMTGIELNMGTWGHYFSNLTIKLGERCCLKMPKCLDLPYKHIFVMC